MNEIKKKLNEHLENIQVQNFVNELITETINNLFDE